MKYIFSVVAFFLVTSTLFSQEEFRQQITLGVRGGMYSSNVYFTPSIDSKPVLVKGGGFYINYISQPHLGVQLEANLMTLGWQDKTDSLGSYSREMTYYQFPFLTHVVFNVKRFQFTLDLGPYVAFYQGMKEEYDPVLRIFKPYFYSHSGEILQSTSILPINTNDSIILGERNYCGVKPQKEFDYGFLGAIGVGVHTKFGALLLEVRYSNGLVGVFKKFPEGNFRYSYNQSFYGGLTYSYAFNLKPPKKKNIKVEK
jgi:hypothetical protein